MRLSKVLAAAAVLVLAANVAVLACPMHGTGTTSGSGRGPSTSSDIASVIASNPNFSTLARLVQSAGLTDSLRRSGSFTVFAPTNAAFARLPQSTLNSLAKPENREQLRSILRYHVVQGRYTSADVSKLKAPTSVGTLEGANLRVAASGGRVRINNATVVTPDISASNGVVHGIDRVLMPPRMTTAPRK